MTDKAVRRNGVYSSRGAARPSQAERWAGEDVLRDSSMRQSWALDPHQLPCDDEWLANPNAFAGIDPSMPLDALALQSGLLHAAAVTDPTGYGADPSTTYPGSAEAAAAYLMLPQNQQEELNASLWDQQACLLVSERGGQSNLLGGDPAAMAAAYYGPMQAGRRVPSAVQYPVSPVGYPGGGMMGGPYAPMARMAMQSAPQPTYTRRPERR